MASSACIYCRTEFDPSRGEGDHVIPAQLGRFVGQIVCRRLCPSCNTRLGPCTEQLIRCGPEAYFRRFVDAAGQRRPGRDGAAGAGGQPSPKHLRDRGDHHELLDVPPGDPENARPMDQLVILDPERGEVHVRLFPGMTVAQLRAKIERLGVPPGARSYFYADDEHWEAYAKLLEELWPGTTVGKGEAVEPGTHRIRGVTMCRFNGDYWRELARIAFHYYLETSRRGVRGDEPEFAAVRRFIMEGGDHRPFFEGPGARFVLPFGEVGDGRAVLPGRWCHFLFADESQDVVLSAVALFAGPIKLPKIHHVTLGRVPSRIIVPGAAWAHAYVYDREGVPDGYAGRVVAEPGM